MVLSADNLERGQVDVYHFDEQSEGMTIEMVLTLKADFVNQGKLEIRRMAYRKPGHAAIGNTGCSSGDWLGQKGFGAWPSNHR